MSLEIRLAYNELKDVKVLFGEYTDALGIDLAFQDYETKIANLPGEYALGMVHYNNYELLEEI